ncbi:MAG: 50S ribosome-binding GTPase [Anaerolineales bacterium]|nr:50S ribosome-binding GTPase [Anaerolineales bacterium]
MNKLIVIVGASGVGKTTLAQALSRKRIFRSRWSNTAKDRSRRSSNRMRDTRLPIKWIICSFAQNRNINFAKTTHLH